MKNAWIENGVIRDLISSDPYTSFTSNIAALYNIQVPDEAEAGDSFINGELIKAVKVTDIPIDNTVVYPTVTKVNFLLLFTGQERVIARRLRTTDPVMDDFWRLLEEPTLTEVNLNLAAVQQGIAYTLNGINQVVAINITARTASILNGSLPT